MTSHPPAKIRMTKQRRSLFEKMQGGVSIISSKTDFGGLSFELSDGSSVSQSVVASLLPLDVFTPAGDGLFGDTQSYRLREGVTCGA